MIIRPARPALAVMIAMIAVEKQDVALFQRLPQEIGDHTMQGWLGPHGRLLDGNGNIIGKIEVGDSAITIDESLPS